LKKAEGVEEAQVSFEKGEAVIRYDGKKISVAKLREVINSTGFKAVDAQSTARTPARRGKRRSR
jgi:copper chaperone CopZ